MVLAILLASLWVLPASAPASAQSTGFSTPDLAAGDSVTFRGAGWGHGVGLSHQSLPTRAAAGQTAGQILGFYYPNTVLTGGWGMNDLRILLATASQSRLRPRGAFELVLDGTTVYSSSTSELFAVARSGSDWAVTASGDRSLCPGGLCSGNTLQIRTADGVAVESSATRHSYSHGQVTLTKMSGNTWYRIVLTSLELEDYLGGVAEVPPDWATEALRAQAIASRTYAVHIALDRRSSETWTAPFDLYATTMNQVYSGNTRETSARNGPWLQAIADTAGQVVTYNNTPALALFTTSGGGYTEASGYAFSEQHPYLVAVPDTYTDGDPHTPWTRTYSVAALSRWLARAPDTNIGTLQRIEISGNISISGRIDRATVRLHGSAATKSVSGQRFVFVVNKGAESEGLGPLPDTAGRGGHLLSTKFVFAEAGAPPPPTGTETGSLPPSLDTSATTPALNAPTAPRSLVVSPRPGEIVVTWQAPASDGGGPITSYVLTWVSSTGASGTIQTVETGRALRNLANGATYTISVTALNSAGTSPAATASASPFGAPGAPRNVSVQQGDGRLGVSWTPPADDGGRAVETYTVHWTAAGGSTGSRTVQGTQHVIEGLANGATYTISVTASNSAGTSPAATASASPSGAPGAPRNVSVQQGDGRLGVSWSPPADDGGRALETYTVHWTAAGGSTDFRTVQGTQHVIEGLTNGATYSITVTATNQIGTSGHSEPASRRPGTLPGAPGSVTAVRGDRRIDATWQPPGNDGGLGIGSYTIGWVSSTGATGTIQTTETSHTLQNLLNGAIYTITVTATNEAGTSAASAPAAATPGAAPSAPGTLTVDRGDGRIDVTWQPPDNNGGMAVQAYTLTWVASDGSTASIDTTLTNRTIEGLTNGTTYTVSVTATNEIGTSAASAPATGTPAHIPGAPVAVSTTRGDGTITVTWQPPASDGGLRVTGYTLLWVAPDGTTFTAETAATSHSIDGLANGATYGITVTATNEIGTSVAANPVRATPARVPGPLAYAEIVIGHETLLVNWQPPNDDGGLPVRSYTLTWVAPDGAATAIDTTQTSHAIEGLIGGATYTITILANNEVGASATPVSAQATPQHAAGPVGGSPDPAAAPSPTTVAPGTAAATAGAAPAPPAPAVTPAPTATTTGSWQDSVTNNTAVLILASVGLVLIGALLAVSRRRQRWAEEAAASPADYW